MDSEGGPTSRPPEPSSTGATPPLGRVGSYQLLVEIAAGGMATVYLARASDGRDAPLVAIKRPHRHLAVDKIYLSMLVDEARLASAIDHECVVKVRELGFEGGEPFIAMDYVEGASLSDVRKALATSNRAIDARVALRMVLDALAGLQAAHVLHDEHGRHMGIVHRDVSPHNVLIGCDGRARLTDFGIAKAEDRVQVTRTHEVKGKLAYLAPERIDKRRICTTQSDVFSMAVVLWECIAGRRLFRGEEAIETLQEVMSAPIPPLRKIGVPVPQALDDAIARALSRDLDTRFKSAAEFSAALMSAAGRDGIAKPAEVACLIETLFGERLRVRHAKIREVVGEGEVERVLEVSGLSARPEPTEEMRARDERNLEAIAPPAPSARYAFGSGSELDGGLLSRARLRYAVLGGVALLGLVVAIGVAVRYRPMREAQADTATPAPTARRVVVPLPFLASKVTFDDESRELSPAADIVAFEVPLTAGVRHRVTAIALDGSRAEAMVREADGVARPEGHGFDVEPLETYPVEPPKPAPPKVATPAPSESAEPKATARPAARPAPMATTKNGFTKLR
ncbi:MAG: serine/threonine protein kinase [Myxococcales bacterium]|nr:serine/threonine protein kinase [Myxococcales bacterium]